MDCATTTVAAGTPRQAVGTVSVPGQTATDASRAVPIIVYVMGYGRSGSTLLDILFGNQSGVLSGGELIEFSKWFRERHLCACGVSVHDCPFWIQVKEVYKQRLGSTLALHETDASALQSRSALVRQLLGIGQHSIEESWHRLEVALFEALVSVGEASVVVDSSKSAAGAAGRALALSSLKEVDVRSVLLVRDLRAVVRSCMREKGSPERPLRARGRVLRGIRGLAGWMITNALCLYSFRRFTFKPIIVRYENLVRQPANELERLGRGLDVDLSQAITRVDQGQALSVGHMIGGNRLRFESAIRIKQDDRWRFEMPWQWQTLCRVMAWPIEAGLRRAERADQR